MDTLTRDEVISLLRNQISDLYNLVHERNQYHGVEGTSTEDIGRMLDRAGVFNKALESFDNVGAI